MSLRRVVSPLLVALILLTTMPAASSVRAWTAMQDPFPSTTPSATYRIDGITNPDWITAINAAAFTWTANTIFDFTYDANSSNVVKLHPTLTCAYLMLMTSTPHADEGGVYRSGFTIDINTNPNCPYVFSPVAGQTPVGTYSLRSVLRHEFGHAAGLFHVPTSGNSAQLMYPTHDIRIEKAFTGDDTAGIEYLYNPASVARMPTSFLWWNHFHAIDGVFDNRNAPVGYKGPGWVHNTTCCPNARQGSLAYSNQAGGTSWFAFTGSRITWELTKHPNRGYNQIWIDGVYTWNPNMNDSNTLWQVRKTWEVNNGEHIIEIRGAGVNGWYTDVDSFIVDVKYSTGNHQNTSPNIKYIGTWTNDGACCHWSDTINSSAAVMFYGTGIRYRYTKASDRGTAKITIDGTYHSDLNQYNNVTLPNQSTQYNLGLGFHQIHVAVKNAGGKIDVDSFEIIP